MTIKELIEQLQKYPDQDMLVLVDFEDCLLSPDDHREIEVYKNGWSFSRSTPAKHPETKPRKAVKAVLLA